ncbi:GntR family transcriptional regulator [Nitratireductor aquimarinus]|uniref:GntR family transcriptional regulator n=1 Tax=Nitratireductor aquimarinus TaxID=889300 RepID=A0ABU4AKC1_9HYPH|nr:GntR family transcriptional regulator [Nitratireductor aquimarinus]MDV6226670.1 GntR family transcriptional regulator [Nitratireductor aquimarinus]
MTGEGRARFERIYALLRSRICLLDYPPGMRLREEDLAEEFETSRTPIRRVLARLEDEGYVRSVHGVGTMVTDIDSASLEQVYRLRVELSELIGRLSPIVPDAETIEAFDVMRRRCEALAKAPDQRTFAQLNMDFLDLLMTLTENEPLREFSERLYYQTTRFWLKTVAGLERHEEALASETDYFLREISDIATAVSCGALETVGQVRRAHVAMSFARLKARARGDVLPDEV